MPPFVLGIAGGTASGKTTVAERVAHELAERALLITHDRYYRSLPADLQHSPTEWNFDAPDSLDTPRLVRDLTGLRQGRSVTLPRYDFATHQRDPAEDAVDPAEVLIIEGILVLAEPELRTLFDHAVFVHTPADLRLMRRIRRDVEERGRDVAEILAQYEKTVRPAHERWVEPSRQHAQTVLDGTADVAALVRQVLDLLASPRSSGR